VRVTVTGPQFVFVQAGHFTEPIRPSTVVVNNTTIINQTSVVNNMRQESRTVAGSVPQKVFVNEGPEVDAVQKATGKHLTARPARELVRTAPIPPAESKSQAPTAASVEKPSSSRSHDAMPHDSQVHGFPAPHQERPTPERPKEHMTQPPVPAKPKEHVSPPATARPPAKPAEPPKEPREDKGHGSEGDQPKGNGHESESHGEADQF
jgi:hypothetical protein